VEGTWSPYISVKQYTPETLFMGLVGFFAFFYFRQWERRKAIEEKAIAEATMGSRTKPSGVRSVSVRAGTQSELQWFLNHRPVHFVGWPPS
jgi:hypothetical protein